MVSRPCNVRMRLAAAAQPKARAIILRLPRIATVAARRRWDWPIAREIMPHLIDRGATSARVDRLNAGGTPPGYRRTRLRGAPPWAPQRLAEPVPTPHCSLDASPGTLDRRVMAPSHIPPARQEAPASRPCRHNPATAAELAYIAQCLSRTRRMT